MTEKLQRARGLMQQERMLPESGSLVLCAVSGGMDSMCLLHFLLKEHGNIAVAHFEHGIRGESSLADAEFVEAECARLGIPCLVGHGDVPRRVRETGESTEEAARKLRYAFLAQTAAELGAERIALAHHADDNAETLLFQLARGSAGAGLGGMPPVRGSYIRPFLTTTKEELRAYAKEQGIVYCKDETNEDMRYARNRIRERVLPELKEVNVGAVEAMSRAMAVQRRENALLDRLAKVALGEVQKDEGAASVPCAVFTAAEEALRPRMLSLLLSESGVGRKDVGAKHFEASLSLIEKGKDGSVSLPGGGFCKLEAEKLTIQRSAPALPVLPLRAGESVDWGNYTISLKKSEKNSPARDSQWALRYAMIAEELCVAPVQSGAGLQLAPSKGRRSLKRLYADAHIAADARQCLPVIYAGGEALAAEPFGVDESLRASASEEALCITIRKREKDTER